MNTYKVTVGQAPDITIKAHYFETHQHGIMFYDDNAHGCAAIISTETVVVIRIEPTNGS